MPELARPVFPKQFLENDRLRARRQCQRLNVRYFPNSETTPRCSYLVQPSPRGEGAHVHSGIQSMQPRRIRVPHWFAVRVKTVNLNQLIFRYFKLIKACVSLGVTKVGCRKIYVLYQTLLQKEVNHRPPHPLDSGNLYLLTL
jgi:hypothetical protein